MQPYSSEWYVDEGNRYLAKAEKALKRNFFHVFATLAGFFTKLFTTQEDLNDSAKTFFERAANCFRIAKDRTSLPTSQLIDQKAADTFMQMAQLEPTEILSAHTLIEAANCMRGSSLEQANRIIEKAAEIYAINGRVGMAAKYMKKIAENYDDPLTYKAAVKYYLKSAELQELEAEESTTSTQAVQRAADLIVLSDIEKIMDAIPLYEKVVQKILGVKVLRTTIRPIILRLILIYLAIDDIVGAERTLNQYQLQEECMGGAREIVLAEGVLETFKAKDVEGFQNVLYKYAKVTPFAPVDRKLLEQVKRHLDNSLEANVLENNRFA